MTKTKAPVVTHAAELERRELQRLNERITYPADHAGPIQMDWRRRGSYSAADL